MTSHYLGETSIIPLAEGSALSVKKNFSKTFQKLCPSFCVKLFEMKPREKEMTIIGHDLKIMETDPASLFPFPV